MLAERTDGLLPNPDADNTVSGEWINGLTVRLTQMLQRVKRVHFKSLGRLLAYQEQLAAELLPTKSETPEREGSSR